MTLETDEKFQDEPSEAINLTGNAPTAAPNADSIPPISFDDKEWVDICVADKDTQNEPSASPASLEVEEKDTSASSSSVPSESEKAPHTMPHPENQSAPFVVFVDNEEERSILSERLQDQVTVYTIDDAENSMRVIDIADCQLSAVHIADATPKSYENGKTWAYHLEQTANMYGRTIPAYRIDVTCIDRKLRHKKTVVDLCQLFTEGMLLYAFLEKAVREAIKRKNDGFELTLPIEYLAERGDEPGNFPIDSFPPSIRDMICAIQRYMQHEKPDMCAVFALGLLSGASMKRFVASHPANGYKYHPNLYVYFMAESSGRKSSAIQILSIPYMEYQKMMEKEAGRDRSKAALHLKRVDAKLTAFEKENIHAQDGELETDRDDEYADLCEKKQEYEHICESDWDIFLPHGNITIQAIPERLYKNHGMMTMISGEDTIIQKLLRYEEDKTEVDILLDGKDANSFGKERVTSGKINIEHPLIALIIGGQSKYFKAFVSDESMKNKGLIARFLFAGMGRKTVARDESDTYRIPSEVAAAYHEHVLRRLRILPILEDYGELMQKGIAWSDAASRLTIAYLQKNVADEELEGKIFAGDNDWSGKQEQAACSIIAILHVDWCLYRNENPFEVPISAETAQKGIDIHYWFLQEFRYWVMNESLMTDMLIEVLKAILNLYKGSDGKLRKKVTDTVTPSVGLHHMTKSKRPTGKGATKTVQELMESLMELGYLKQDEHKRNLFIPNPYIFR